MNAKHVEAIKGGRDVSEADRILNFLASMPNHANIVVDRAIARELLSKTDALVMARGSLWDLIAKPAGAGMYRLSLKEHQRREGEVRQ